MLGSRFSYLILSIIIIICVVLSYSLYTGPFYSFDDGNYIVFAHQILDRNFSLSQNPYAYGFLMPLTLVPSLTIFGINLLAITMPAFIEYIIIVILAFFIGKKLYGNEVGLVSAFLISTAPFVVGYSTRVLPDMAVGVLSG